MRIETMDINAIAPLLGDATIQIIDLRNIRDYRRKHIPGAIHVELDDITSGQFIPDESKRIYLYCDKGSGSYQATVYLTEQGYHAIDLLGGFRSYRKQVESSMN